MNLGPRGLTVAGLARTGAISTLAFAVSRNAKRRRKDEPYAMVEMRTERLTGVVASGRLERVDLGCYRCCSAYVALRWRVPEGEGIRRWTASWWSW